MQPDIAAEYKNNTTVKSAIDKRWVIGFITFLRCAGAPDGSVSRIDRRFLYPPWRTKSVYVSLYMVSSIDCQCPLSFQHRAAIDEDKYLNTNRAAVQTYTVGRVNDGSWLK